MSAMIWAAWSSTTSAASSLSLAFSSSSTLLSGGRFLAARRLFSRSRRSFSSRVRSSRRTLRFSDTLCCSRTCRWRRCPTPASGSPGRAGRARSSSVARVATGGAAALPRAGLERHAGNAVPGQRRLERALADFLGVERRGERHVRLDAAVLGALAGDAVELADGDGQLAVDRLVATSGRAARGSAPCPCRRCVWPRITPR